MRFLTCTRRTLTTNTDHFSRTHSLSRSHPISLALFLVCSHSLVFFCLTPFCSSSLALLAERGECREGGGGVTQSFERVFINNGGSALTHDAPDGVQSPSTSFPPAPHTCCPRPLHAVQDHPNHPRFKRKNLRPRPEPRVVPHRERHRPLCVPHPVAPPRQ